MNYKGSISNLIFAAIENKPQLKMGEILYSFLSKGKLKKHYLEATDEEIYTSLEDFLSEKEEVDEPLDEQEFYQWTEQVTCKTK